jgi:hypothetical protein
LEPALEIRTVLDQHVGIVDGLDILRRRLIVFGRCADRDEAADAGRIADDGYRQRSQRRGGCNEGRSPVRRSPRGMRTTGEQYDGKHRPAGEGHRGPYRHRDRTSL